MFQPIIDAKKGGLYGYEALSRPSEDAFGDIVDAIATAERAGQVVEQIVPPLIRIVAQAAVEMAEKAMECDSVEEIKTLVKTVAKNLKT